MELYERYHLMLYHAAYGILKNRDDAQDAMQEGMISAFEKLDQFKGEGDFGGFFNLVLLVINFKVIYGGGSVASFLTGDQQ